MITVIAAMAVATHRLACKRITLSEISSIVAAATASGEKEDGDKDREILVIV